jgi:uncharacterized protein YbjT (DUF2867 family)
MHVMVLGATGFLGSGVVAALQDAGHRITVGARDVAAAKRRWPDLAAVPVDFSQPRDAALWLPILQGVDAVVNAVGVFRETAEHRFEPVHVLSPQAMYAACVEAGVRRVVHVSALGADALAETAYHRSKRRLDDFLLALPLRAVVVQPSLIFGEGGASARLFLALARLPLLPLPAGGLQSIQPVHRNDAVAAIVRLVGSDAGGRIALVGPVCMTVREYVATLRQQLGFRPANAIAVRSGLAAKLASLTPLAGIADQDALSMLERGNCADDKPIAAILERPPRHPRTFLADATWASWAAAWFWLEPAARWSLCWLWIWSGLVSAGSPAEDSLGLLGRVGLHGAAAILALWAAVGLDVLAGVLLLFRRWRTRAYLLQLALMAGYTAVITVGLPEFWLHPYAPIAKNLPIAALTVLLMLMEPPRGLPRR